MVDTSLYIFNPDHDMALANCDPNYMAPAAARRLALDLALLPIWYARSQDFVLATSNYNQAYLEEMRKYFPPLPSLLTAPEVAGKDLIPIPWGWNPAVRKQLYLSGIPELFMPDNEAMNHIRSCSHRSVAVDLLPSLLLNNHFCGESFYLQQIEEMKDFVESRSNCLLKAPLSGSGKGLNWCKGVFTSHIHNWCRNVLRQQSGVVGEPLYNKVLDFAMQFKADSSGQVSFQGYSLFYTHPGGAYDGNSLNTNKEIESRLTAYIPGASLNALRDRLEKELTHRLNHSYKGYLGVDMMICEIEDRYCIHPCVEINLRMNMGMVARLFYDNYVHEGKTGVYRIVYYGSNEELQAGHEVLQQEHPLNISNNRIEKGYLPLVPITPQSKYNAYSLIY